MAKIDWVFTNQTTGVNFTSSVMSANYMYLRTSYKDYYSGSNLVITIKNQTNEARYFTLNDVIFLSFVGDGSSETWRQNYYVSEIEFNDYPGNTGQSTATITCQDWLARAARVLGGGVSLPATDSLQQLYYFSSAAGGPLPPGMEVGGYGNSLSPAVTWTDSVVNKIQTNQLTENSTIGMVYQRVELYKRSDIYMSIYKFDRNAAANTVVYQTFKRIQAGQSLINYEETNSTLGTVTASNAASTSTYGSYAESVDSADANLTQQQGLAQFRSNTQSDPTSTRFEITVSDIATDRVILDNMLAGKGNITPIYYLTYRKPGAASDTTVRVKQEGINVSITPSQTVFTFFLSPAIYYEMFVLNSSIFGILNSSRLGW
jgi:hypothetical protein